MSARSKIQPRPKLDRPVAADGRDLPENRRRNRRRDASERAPVKRVQEFGANLKFGSFSDRDDPEQREIHTGPSWPAQDVMATVAESALSGLHKGRRVEVFRDLLCLSTAGRQ